jgi:hypothetical protein
MDHSATEEEAKIRDLMERHQSQFIDFHKVKTRKSGARAKVQDSYDFT